MCNIFVRVKACSGMSAKQIKRLPLEKMRLIVENKRLLLEEKLSSVCETDEV